MAPTSGGGSGTQDARRRPNGDAEKQFKETDDNNDNNKFLELVNEMKTLTAIMRKRNNNQLQPDWEESFVHQSNKSRQ